MVDWKSSGPADGKDYADIRYETAAGIAKITINRPEVRNAFRPTTLYELSHAFNMARDDAEVGVIILTGPATRRSAPAATSGSAATPGTWTPKASPG